MKQNGEFQQDWGEEVLIMLKQSGVKLPKIFSILLYNMYDRGGRKWLHTMSFIMLKEQGEELVGFLLLSEKIKGILRGYIFTFQIHHCD